MSPNVVIDRDYLRELSSKDLLEVNLSGHNEIADGDIEALQAPNLVSLNVSDCYLLTDAALERIGSLFPKLKHLDISHCELMTDRGISYLKPLKLKSLVIHGPFKTQGVECITRNFTQLKKLHLDHIAPFPHITNRHLKWIGRYLKDLTDLSLVGAEMINLRGIRHIAAGNVKLRRLNLKRCQSIDNICVFHLAKSLKHLRELNLCSCISITNMGFLGIKTRLSRLKILDISWCRNINDFEYLNKSLRKLYLRQCLQITDDHLTQIFNNAKKLKVIDLFGCDLVTNEGLKLLSSHSKLQDVNIGSLMRVDQDGIRPLFSKRLSLLNSLDLSSVQVADKDMKIIARHTPNAKKVILRWNKLITDEALIHISKYHKHLETLRVLFCRKIKSAKGIKRIVAKNRQLKDLSYSPRCSSKTIRFFAKSLPNLRSLSLDHLKDKHIKIIAENFPNLRELSIGISADVTGKGLRLIGDHSKLLRSVAIRSGKKKNTIKKEDAAYLIDNLKLQRLVFQNRNFRLNYRWPKRKEKSPLKLLLWLPRSIAETYI